MIKAKRFLLVIVSLFVIIIFAACGESKTNNDNNIPSTSGNNSTPNTSDNTSSGDTNQSTDEDKYYTITFKNDNGDMLLSDSYKEGTMPSYNGTPTKENTAEYSYIFSGWNPSITTVTKDCEYVATYTVTKNNYYTVTWKNLTGDIIEVDENVKEGTMPEFNSTISIPKELSEFISLFKDQYNIEMNVVFKSWDKEISPVTKNITYTATYESLTVLWYLREKNIVLYYADMVDGVMPEYKGETPKLECDEKNYYYEFDKFEYIVDNEGGFFIYYYAPKFNRLECKNTITFNLDGGYSTTGEALSIKVNDIKDIEVPTNIKKSSYVFKGYEYNGVKVYDEYGKKVSDFELKENMTFTAIYEKKIILTVNYTIYDPTTNKQLSSYTKLPSGLGDVSLTNYYDWNTYVDLYAYPSEGYTFVGWYNNGQVLSNEKDYKYMMWDEDFTIEARFKYTLYDLTVWSNNTDLGQVIIKNGNSQTFYNNQTLAKYYTQYVTIVAYTKSDTRRFLGWYDENNKLISTKASYDFYMLNRNYKLEAKWDKFNITYDLDGGINNENNPIYYSVDMENITLLEPTKEEYTFIGWEYNSNVITEINISNICHMELKALWTYYTLTTDLNNSKAGTITPYDNVKVTKGNTITLVATTNPGYTFNGWYDGDDQVSPLETYTFNMPASNLSYTAKWTANTNTTYKVEHYLQNLDDDNYPNTPCETDNLTGTTDTLTNGEVNTYEGFTSPTITQVNINANGSTVIKLYYTRNSYTVSLSKNNDKAGTITGSGTYKFGKEIKITATTNPGYTFNGWYDGDNQVSPLETYTFNMPANNLSYTAKWTANTNTTYKVEHYLQNLDDDNYPELPYETDNLTGTTYTLTNGEVNTYEGFTSPTITQVNINGNGSTVIKLYYIRNSYTVSLSKNIDKAGTITGAGTYKYGKEITITATTNPGYTFNGWYLNGSLYEEDASFTYKIGATKVSFEARYTPNKYTITLDNQAEGVSVSGITSGNEYEFDIQITLIATNIQDGYTIKWSRSDGIVYANDSITFNVPDGDITITTTIVIPPYTRSGSKIHFGTYPQTKVTDDKLISELNTLAGTKPTSTNSYNWTDYNYYISSNITSFMFYQDIDYDNNGTFDYRGVYFIRYRPNYGSDSESTSLSYSQRSNYYSTNTIYWFSYDPIEWNILTEENGKALLLANLILDSQGYYNGYLEEEEFSHNGGTGYANNYELSAIRKFLNDNFYNTAFNDLQKELIDITTIDNSASTTSSSKNKYACDNTEDKLFLLSYSEVTSSTYGLNSPTARQAKGTDYAKCQGLTVSTSSSHLDYSTWWLRSPYNSFNAHYVYCNGNLYNDLGYYGSSVGCITVGVRPACWINL